MTCLYCGREIGPIQLLRDDEFCSADHRRSFSDRLSKGLRLVAAHEPAPEFEAGFLPYSAVQTGPRGYAAADYLTGGARHPIEITGRWQLRVPPVFGREAKQIPGAEPRTRERARSVAAADLSRPALILPPFTPKPSAAPLNEDPRDLLISAHRQNPLESPEPELSISPSSDDAGLAEPHPPLCRAWKMVGRPESAEREIQPILASSLLWPRRRIQEMPAVIAGASQRAQLATAASLDVEAEAVAVEVQPIHSSTIPQAGGTAREIPNLLPGPCRRAGLETAALLPIPQPEAEEGIPNPASPEGLDPAAEFAPQLIAALPEFSGIKASLDRLAPLEPAAPIPLDLIIANAGLHLRPAAIPAVKPNAKTTPPPAAAGLPEFAGIAAALDHRAPAEAQRPISLDSLPGAAGLPLRPAAIAAGRADLKPAALPQVPPAPAVEIPALALKSAGAEALEIGPPAGFIALEYYSHRKRSGIRLQVAALAPQPAVMLPAFSLDFVKGLGQAAQRKPAAASARTTRVIQMPGQVRTYWKERTPARKTATRALQAIAAGLVLGVGLWTGIKEVGRGGLADAVKQDAFARYATAPPATPPGAATQPAHGPVGWIRKAVTQRAAVEWTDSFKGGMEAWGMPAKSWATGWSPHPGGGVRTGKLAVFQPSQAYRDYHMEFFAQIENKSVGWVVRARDNQNYYAMKLTVIEPGPRTVVAIAHYSVIGGKRGKESKIPLNAMVHKDQPISVAVDVKGKRVVTSLDGQEVDSWTDDSLASGGVGFFSEAGEQARLYWMKLAANNDLLGRICARVAGAFAPETQAVATPAGPGAPFAPGPVQPTEAALVAAIGFVKNRRKQPWNS